MKKHKITLDKIEKWKDVLFDLFNWNNKDIILFSFKGELYNMHFRLVHGLTRLNENKNFSFNVFSYYSNAEFIKNNEDLSLYNIIMCTHMIEDITEDFLIVKKDNLLNYKLPFDKEVIVLELHSGLLSNHMLVTKIDSLNLDFSERKDFSKINKSKGKIIKLFNV